MFWLPLTLLVSGIGIANDANDAFAFDHLAIAADLLD